MERKTCAICGRPLPEDAGGRRKYCGPGCKSEALRRAQRERGGMDPTSFRRDPAAGLAKLGGRTRVLQSKAWMFYAELLASETEIIEHKAAVELLGDSEKRAWEALLQLERLGLLVRDRFSGPWRVLPPASAEARAWVAASLAGGSAHQASRSSD